MEVEANEVAQLEWLARHGVLAELLDVRDHVDDVEHRTIRCADRVLEAREGDGTAMERKLSERESAAVLVTPALRGPLLRRDVHAVLHALLPTHLQPPVPLWPGVRESAMPPILG